MIDTVGVKFGLIVMDPVAVFCIQVPVVVTVKGIPFEKKTFDLSYHPHGEKGNRKLAVTDIYYLEEEDHNAVAIGSGVRFMDAMNVKKIADTVYEFVSFDHDKSLGNNLIHFVPKNGNEIKGTILLPDLNTQEIICEANASELKVGDVIQFERYAFCRLDNKTESGLEFWFTHD